MQPTKVRLRHRRNSPAFGVRLGRAISACVEQLEGRLLLSALAPAPAAGAALINSSPISTQSTPSGALLADIDPRDGSSNPTQFKDAGGTVYFVAQVPNSTLKALYKSDGTAVGTIAEMSFAATSTIKLLTNVSGTFFYAIDQSLYDVDANNQVTLLKTFPVPVPPALTNTFQGMLNASGGVALGNAMYFGANDPTNGTELWRSDGTVAGTQMVKDIDTGSLDSNPRGIINVAGTLYFQAGDSPHGLELWKSDGTTDGTVLVKDILPGIFNSLPASLTNVGGTIYFNANDGTHGTELWRSDGTTDGTVLVKDITAGSAGSNPTSLTNVNGTLFFVSGGNTLMVSDGTASGTIALPTSGVPTLLTAVGSKLFFLSGGSQLWTSDGTPAGTALVTTVNGASQLIACNGELLFNATDAVNGNELWISDGTAAGTHLLKDINAGSASSQPTSLTLSGGQVYFSADDLFHGREIWRTDGTATGTVLVSDIDATIFSSNPSGFVAFNHNAFFFANGPQGNGLYRSDGTPEGTFYIAPATTGPVAGLGNSIYYVSNGTLYRNDGTPGGNLALATIGKSVQAFYAVNGLLMLSTVHATGQQIWRSDGTPAGTYPVFSAASFNSIFTPTVGGDGRHLFFDASEPAYGYEPWVSDGTVAGTFMLKDINPGASSSAMEFDSLTAMATVRGGVVFAATDPNVSEALWFSDGTVAGTHELINPATAQPFIFNFDWSSDPPTYVSGDDGKAYFLSTNGSVPTPEVTDGTVGGTVSLATLVSQTVPETIINFNGSVYAAYLISIPGLHQTSDVWRIDEAAQTAQRIASIQDDLNAGPTPLVLKGVGTTLYIQTRTNGVWASDGTAAGTVQLPPGSTIPTPPNQLLVDGGLFYANTDSVHGTELWFQPPAVLPEAPSDVTGLRAVPASNTEIDLSWANTAINASSVRVERSTDPSFATSTRLAILLPSATSYQDTQVPAGGTFYYRVYAQNLGGTSATISSSAQIAPLVLSGGSSFYLKADPDGADLDVWIDASPAVAPTQVQPLSSYSSLAIHGTGATEITVDESAGEILRASNTFDTGGSLAAVSLDLIGGIGSNSLLIDASNSIGFNGAHTITLANATGLTYMAGPASDAVFLAGPLPLTLNLGAGSLSVSVAAGADATLNLGSSSSGVTITNSGNLTLNLGSGNPAIQFVTVAPPAGGETTDNGAGTMPPPKLGSISGWVFNDLNHDSVREASEKMLSGRTVYLDLNHNGALDKGEPTSVTAADGSYHFANLAPGDYRAREIIPSGWRASGTNVYFITLKPGQSRPHNDFAQTQAALLSGTVFKDTNGNGKRDPRETTLAGSIVFIDSNNNGRLDKGELSTLTDAAGNYHFVLSAGTYDVRVVQPKSANRSAGAMQMIRLLKGAIVSHALDEK